ncbi:MAG: spore maturation protein [Alphaproteobacteria bacterium]|nr:spore maturation protein [Alphaproteobacteria bacterium]
MLNYIWAFFFVSAFIGALYQAFFNGQLDIWQTMTETMFSSSKSAFTISLNLTGILCFWLGMMKIAEKSGITDFLASILYPLFRKIMPDVPKKSPALGSIVMNIAANVLGLDNAATPMGIKAMEQLQVENPNKKEASNAQILFMVINSSSVTLVPITILMYRSELGSTNPSLVFLPILFATCISTLVGFLSVAMVQKINIFNRIVLIYISVFITIISLLCVGFSFLSAEVRNAVASDFGNFIIGLIVCGFIIFGLFRKVKVYDEFIEGAKDGFNIAISIIPYLVAMLVGIALFRTSGVMEAIIIGVKELCLLLNINADFVPALPTALLKPLSGSGARAMMIETMQTYGADSFPAFVSAVVQGSTETTFYVLAVYFGAVKISNTRHALPCALLADFAGIVSAILFSYWFYIG